MSNLLRTQCVNIRKILEILKQILILTLLVIKIIKEVLNL